MPSSSASVAATPSSSPSTRRRSISRRCSGVYPARYGASRFAVAGSTRSAVKRWISSALRRLFAKQIVRSPRETSAAYRRVASPIADARWPSSSSSSGGFHSATVRSARGAASVADDRDVHAEQRLRELARVRDRRRREQELRLGAVDAREPAQPAQDVPDVRAEHAAVDVRLVDDDVAEVREHVSPAVVVRQDADVEHVRVREDEVRPAADLPAPLARRVAVVDRGARARELERGERARLVLRERLRRVEVERAQLRVARDRVEHGEVERERLSRRGAGRDDDVLAAPRGVPRLALVRVERVVRQRVAHERMQVVREAARVAPRARARSRGARAPRPASRSSQRASSTATPFSRACRGRHCR